MGHQARVGGKAPAYYDNAPIITDAGYGMALICQPDGSDPCVMPDDIVEAFAIALVRYSLEKQARRASVVVPFVQEPQPIFIVEMHD